MITSVSEKFIQDTKLKQTSVYPIVIINGATGLEEGSIAISTIRESMKYDHNLSSGTGQELTNFINFESVLSILNGKCVVTDPALATLKLFKTVKDVASTSPLK